MYLGCRFYPFVYVEFSRIPLEKGGLHIFPCTINCQTRVYRIMQGARARWRIENETFNTLKNQGYHFEHNFGHGYEHLSVVFAELMMLAFLVDQVQQLCCPLFQEARAKWGSKRLLWEKMRALFFDYALASMRELFEALVYGLKKSAPILATDSS